MKPFEAIDTICVQMRGEADAYGNSKIARLFRDTSKRIELELGFIKIRMSDNAQKAIMYEAELDAIRSRRGYKILKKLRLLP